MNGYRWQIFPKNLLHRFFFFFRFALSLTEKWVTFSLINGEKSHRSSINHGWDVLQGWGPGVWMVNPSTARWSSGQSFNIQQWLSEWPHCRWKFSHSINRELSLNFRLLPQNFWSEAVWLRWNNGKWKAGKPVWMFQFKRTRRTSPKTWHAKFRYRHANQVPFGAAVNICIECGALHVRFVLMFSYIKSVIPFRHSAISVYLGCGCGGPCIDCIWCVVMWRDVVLMLMMIYFLSVVVVAVIVIVILIVIAVAVVVVDFPTALPAGAPAIQSVRMVSHQKRFVDDKDRILHFCHLPSFN